jgi:sirohydrochlorin cobaltochelatase
MRGIVLFAHGARDPEWARPFEAIRDRIRAARPEFHVELAYLEVMGPTLEEAIATLVRQGAPSITVYPLFMAQGGHLKKDVPRILDGIRASCPNVPIALESAVGEVPQILDAIRDWILGSDPGD